jgi:hypothetical protein
MMRSVRVALAVGLALTAAVVGVAMSRSRLTVAGTNGVPFELPFESVPGGSSGCQESGTMPQGTTAIRVSFGANMGPKVSLKVLSGSAVITHGERHAGWGFAKSVTVPVKRVSRTVPHARVCITFGPDQEPVEIYGTYGRIAIIAGAESEAALYRVEYLRPGQRSWWSLASSVAHHMGLGRAGSGTWIVFFVIALMITITILMSRLILREMP